MRPFARTLTRVAPVIGLLAVFACGRSASAQDSTAQGRVLVTSAAVAGTIDHRVDVGGGVERTTGPVFGIQVDASRNPDLIVSLRALGGSLSPRSPVADQRDVGEIGGDVRIRVLSWLDARGGATVRSFTSELARQRWTELSVGADMRVGMLGGRIDGTAGAALLPYVRVSGHQSPGLAIAASMGLRHTSKRYELGLLYQLERYDFAALSGVSRAEEHSVLLLRAGYRIGIGHSAR